MLMNERKQLIVLPQRSEEDLDNMSNPFEKVSTTSSPTTKNRNNLYAHLLVCGACWFFFLIPLFIGLSVHVIRYSDLGLIRHVTGVVEYDHVLTQDRWFLPLGHHPIRFDYTLQRVSFLSSEKDALVVFSEQGLEFAFNIEFYYQVLPEKLGKLYQTYGLNYHDRINKVSQSVLKDQATRYSSDQFIRNRTLICHDFGTLLKSQLEEKMNIKIDKVFVVLLEIHFPVTLVNKNMEATLEIQNNVLQQNQQRVDLVRAETLVMVSRILAEADYLVSSAEIQANQTLSQAQIDVVNMQLDAHREGLKYAQELMGLSVRESELLMKAMTLQMMHELKLFYTADSTTSIIFR